MGCIALLLMTEEGRLTPFETKEKKKQYLLLYVF